ncbi:MAG TPA: purine-nucleoside phosphorylase [Candidatus Caccovivens faecavium]|nr:purine-nucleoside phosphorylase [Candidatus Caccovivens faecavium]
MATPHMNAKKSDIAKVVIMAGDPVRIKNMAEKFLDNARCVNDTRGMLAYTGTHNGKKITFMAHGIGCPSMGIYSYELFAFYGVETIIRVGTIGALKKEIGLKNIIIADRSYTKTNFDDFYIKNGASFVEGSSKLSEKAVEICEKYNVKYYYGNIYCSDNFYTDFDQIELAKEKDLLGVEMESASLYLNAKKFKKDALTMCVVSDSLVTKKALSASERANSFDNIVKVALSIALKK